MDLALPTKIGRSVRRQLQSGDFTVLAIPGFFATMGLEYVVLRRAESQGRMRTLETTYDTDASNAAQPVGYEPRDTMASLSMGVGSLVANGVASLALAPVDRWLYRHRIANLGAARWGFVAALVAWDFLYYWDHRYQHVVRLGWANHVAHHSSQRYNLSTALRQPWSGFMMHWFFAPMLLLGFTPAQTARAGEINLLYQYWVHTEAIDRLPAPVEAVMNTASHHRVHHGADQQYLDRNYAGILIIWDRLFGSFEPEGERVHYGLTKNIDTHNPVRVAYHEFADIVRDVRRARTWKERFGYVFKHPGWKPSTELVDSPTGT